MATFVENPKLVFIHIPKNAGTSVNFWLKKNLKGEKKGITHGGIQHIPEIWNDAFTFAIVRNPWDRTLSFWSFLKGKIARKLARAKDGSKEQEGLQLELALIKSGFENWVYEGGLDYPLTNNKKSWFRYRQNQIDWLPKNPTHILKYEKLNKHFQIIQEFTNCYIPLSKNNTSSHENYRTYYNPHLKNYIGDIFDKDIKRFNYDF